MVDIPAGKLTQESLNLVGSHGKLNSNDRAHEALGAMMTARWPEAARWRAKLSGLLS